MLEQAILMDRHICPLENGLRLAVIAYRAWSIAGI